MRCQEPSSKSAVVRLCRHWRLSIEIRSVRQATGDEVDWAHVIPRAKSLLVSFLKAPGFDFRSSCKGVWFFAVVKLWRRIWQIFLSGHESGPTNRGLGRLSILEVEPLDVAKTGFLEITGIPGLRCMKKIYQIQPCELIYTIHTWPFFSHSPLDGVRLTERGANVFVSYNYPPLGSRL